MISVRVRAGIDSGRRTLTDAGEVGRAVHTVTADLQPRFPPLRTFAALDPQRDARRQRPHERQRKSPPKRAVFRSAVPAD